MSSLDDIYSSVLTERETSRLVRALSKVKKSHHCLLWDGKSRSKDGYGIIFFLFRGRRKKLKVHRVQYFLTTGEMLDKNMDVSHICHKKLCINFDHLSYEPHIINCKRNSCRDNGECEGHRGYKSCIL